MKQLYIVFFVWIISYQVFAQHSHRAYVTLADSLFRYHNYKDATYYYQRAIKNSKEPGNIMLKIARAFTEMNDVKAAEAWYEKAKANGASFSAEDTHHYVKELIMLERRNDAEIILRDFLKDNPDARYARELLEDLESTGKYFTDTSSYKVKRLSISTSDAEFAPVYYKDGLVFTSDQPLFLSKKKYHWDNSTFLNLFHTKIDSDQRFQKPVLFDKELNTHLHDGPVSFYANDERMILNRNMQMKMQDKADTYVSHLTLFDVGRGSDNKTWEFTPLPFEQSSCSFGHPNVSNDGNTLYFISDKPGGYGGTDIYLSIRSNGQWSTPLNVGPDINTPENETFPFFLDNTLYFASDGHGGLGGLDLFKSTRSANGFAPPVNLGHPINSHVDDFSLITKDHRNGYFSSARKGSDDLYEFHRRTETIKILARLCDAVTNVSLPGGTIQLLTTVGDKLSMTSGKGGNIRFELPEEAAYVMIATKDGKTGVLSGLAMPDQDYQHIVHQVPAYGDTAFIACVGTLKNEAGQLQSIFKASVVDEATGKKTQFATAKSLISFQGEKGRRYRVEAQDETGNAAEYTLNIEPGEREIKTWSMTVKNTPALTMLAVKVLDERTSLPIGGADVRITTLAEPDVELKADERGYAQFPLPVNAAYVIMAMKDSLAGMHYGFAEKISGKDTIVYPVYIKQQTFPKAQVVALVKNARGDALHNAKITITNEVSGKPVPYKMENGLLHFFANPNEKYTVGIEHSGYATATEKITVPENAGATAKHSIVLSEIKPVIRPMAGHVFKEKDNSSLPGAAVKIMRFSVSDLSLIANDKGIVEFSVPEGESYIASASKDGFTGAYMGIAESAADSTSNIHPILVKNSDTNSAAICGKITDQAGVAIPNTIVEVTDTKTGEKIPGRMENGMLSFQAKRNGDYRISASAGNYTTVEKTVSADSSGFMTTMPAIALSKRIPITTKVGNSKGEVLKNAIVRVTDETTGKQVKAEFKEGVLTFTSEQGKTYDITVEHPDHEVVSEELIVPRLVDAVDPFYIALSEKRNRYAITARVSMQLDSAAVVGAEVKVISFAADDIDLVSGKDGIVGFNVPEGTAYIAVARKEEYSGVYAGISENDRDNGTATIHQIVVKNTAGAVPVLGFISDESGLPLSSAHAVVTDSNTGEPVDVKMVYGILSFDGKKGTDYKIDIAAEGYEAQMEGIKIDPQASNIQIIEITATRRKFLALPAGSTLIAVNNESPRLYITSQDSHDEIIEEKGVLYLKNTEGTKPIGVGSLQVLMEKPSRLIALAEDQVVWLDNIYFDFNSALLDKADQQVLEKVKEVIVRYPLLKLFVNAHADMRGSVNYNLGLTRKRARAIRRELLKLGLRPRHISIRAYGKSVPVVICDTDECSEQQHQRNRRAEFELAAVRKAKLQPIPVVKPQPAGTNPLAEKRVKTTYAELLAKYGDRQMEDLAFKICVGAYRLNPNLTFQELTDLGNVAKRLRGGIHYYYLQEFQTLNAAESIRQQVISRGIEDAYVTIFYKGNKMSFTQFIALTE